MKSRARFVSGLAALAAFLLAPRVEASLTRATSPAHEPGAPVLTLTSTSSEPSEFPLLEGTELTVAAAESEPAQGFHPLAAVSLFSKDGAEGPLVSVDEASYPKTLYRVFRFLGTNLVGVERGVSLELDWGCADFSCGLASGTVGGFSKDPLGLESLGQMVHGFTENAWGSGGPWWKKALAIGAEGLYATAEMASVGAISRIDKSQEAMERGEIDGWGYTGQVAGTIGRSAAVMAAGGAGGQFAARAAQAAGLGVRAAGAAGGAAGGIASKFAEDVVDVKLLHTRNEFSAASEYGSAAVVGAAFGLAEGIKQSQAKGSNHERVRRAARTGNRVHYDELNGGMGQELPTELSKQYPETEFRFARRGEKGADVTVVGGRHPSKYPGSTWDPANAYGDFKPNTDSGHRTFGREVGNGKLPTNTQELPYDPKTGDKAW